MNDAGGAPPPPVRWERHPADLARLVLSLAAVVGLVAVGWAFETRLAEVSSDLVRLLANIPRGLAALIVGLVQLTITVAAPVVIVSLAVRRKGRLLGLLTVAAAAAAGLMTVIEELLGDGVPADLAGRRAVDSWLTGSAYPSAALLAAAAAVVTATAPFTTRSWHRWAWGAVGGIAALRLLTATEVPINLLLILAIGAATGSAALVVMGAPPRRVDPGTVDEALAAAGVTATSVVRVGEERGAAVFRVSSPEGDLRAVLLGRDQRDHDLLLRFWRSLRIKGFDERRPSASPRRAAEHELLSLALSQAAGVACPAPVTVGLTEDGAAVVVTEWRAGVALGAMDPAAIDDETLVETWRAVGRLHGRRIAHRWLDLDSILVADGEPTLVGFRWATTSSAADLRGADVAELLSAMAVHVGPERAVATAVAGLGPEPLAEALPLFQPLVLSSATRDALKASETSLGGLRDALQEAVGAEKVELAPLRRVSLQGVVSLVGSIVLAGYVFSLASDWRSIADAFGEMDLGAAPVLLAFVLVSNAGGSLSLMGSVNVELAFLRTSQVMWAQGFLNRFTPANAGGMALRARYLQREGVELSVGAAAVGITSVVSGALQFVLLVVFLVWGGATNELSRFELPSTTRILALVVGAGIVGGAVALSGWGRRVVVPKVKSTAGPAAASLVALARQPRKLAQLLGGTALSKVATLVSFAVTCEAFGVEMGFARIGALYMVANTIGSAVPTPGGVGGLEAALTAALISAGVDAPTAGAIVLVFRLFTFWFPTLPGWLFLRRVQSTGVV